MARRTFAWECLYCGAKGVAEGCATLEDLLPVIEASHEDQNVECEHRGEEQIRCQ